MGLRNALEQREQRAKDLALSREKLSRTESLSKALPKKRDREWAAREIADLKTRLADLEANL